MTDSKTSNLGKRVATGLLGGAVVVAGLIWGGVWFYFTFFLLLCFGALYEFYGLLRKAGHRPFLVGGLLLGVFWYVAAFVLCYKQDIRILYLVPIAVLSIFLLFIVRLYAKSGINFRDAALTFLGILYIVAPLLSLHGTILFRGRYAYEIILGILVSVWAADTGAYFTGKTIGRKKLFPSISPGKTWEGAVGGFVLACLAGFLWSLMFDVFPTWKWMGLSAVVAVFGIFGDLVESAFKRELGVKDSGNLLPGHGGLLDRFDAFLFCLPFAVTFLLLV